MFQPVFEGAGAGGSSAPIGTATRRLPRFNAIRRIDFAVDLAEDIGSRRWWLGAGACVGLCGVAVALAFQVPALVGTRGTPVSPAALDAQRPQAIAPLARGATTGTQSLPNPQLVERLAEAPERPRLELTASIGRRDSFEAALRRAGVGRDDIAEVTKLLRPVANIGNLPRGTDIDLVLGRRETRSVPRPLDLIGFRAAFDLRVAIARQEGALVLKRIPIAIDSTPLRVQGTVGNGLSRALSGAGVPAAAVADAVRALGYVVDFQRGIGKRDRFDVIVAQDRAETGEVRFGNLLQVGLKRDGKEAIELTRFGSANEFFRANGESARKGLMKTPVNGARLTSGFGMRFHPLLSYSRMHQGVDFGAPMGAPIFAAASGVVNFAGRHGGHGNYVRLVHNRDLTTGYAHMSRFAVKAGQRVSQGQVIGYVGSTGISTGPHLHYEVWLRGKPVSPMQLKFVGGSQLAGAELARFKALATRLGNLSVTGGARKAA